MAFGFSELADLLASKKKQVATDQGVYDSKHESLIARSHEADSGWMRLGTLLSGSVTKRILMEGFKALIDLDEIIIRQNELILRTLTKRKDLSKS